MCNEVEDGETLQSLLLISLGWREISVKKAQKESSPLTGAVFTHAPFSAVFTVCRERLILGILRHISFFLNIYNKFLTLKSNKKRSSLHRVFPVDSMEAPDGQNTHTQSHVKTKHKNKVLHANNRQQKLNSVQFYCREACLGEG